MEALKCSVCGAKSKSAAGLASHRRARHPDGETVGTAVDPSSVTAAVRARVASRLDDPLAHLAIGLAMTFDDPTTSPRDGATISRELRLALEAFDAAGPQAVPAPAVGGAVFDIDARRREREARRAAEA